MCCLQCSMSWISTDHTSTDIFLEQDLPILVSCYLVWLDSRNARMHRRLMMLQYFSEMLFWSFFIWEGWKHYLLQRQQISHCPHLQLLLPFLPSSTRNVLFSVSVEAWNSPIRGINYCLHTIHCRHANELCVRHTVTTLPFTYALFWSWACMVYGNFGECCLIVKLPNIHSL